ncbi:MAG TPA: nuclear transport factor 2 family protein [Polyangiaceae bacterium]|nr:nuclear transport factor 2 family protein [Polyangiaceae bacterium]
MASCASNRLALMKLYASPLSCSMATKIVLEELGRACEVIYVDATTRLAPDGFAVPLGQVPALRLEDGRVLTENAAILRFVAEGTELVPTESWQRTELTRWLAFIGTELHKVVFIPLLDPKADEGVHAYALDKAPSRLRLVDEELSRRNHLLESYSVADIYLATVLNWAQATPLRLDEYPGLLSFMARMKARPTVARILAEEHARYRAERAHSSARHLGTRAVLDRFNQVFQRREPAALDSLVADGCVLENTDGKRLEGKAAAVGLWTSIATDASLSFDLKDVRTSGDVGIITWVLLRDGRPVGDGINVMRVRDGRVWEARGYMRPSS